MNIFIILNIIKTIIGASIIYLTCNYIDLGKDFVVWVLSMGIGIFILVWSISFFILLLVLKLATRKKFSEIALTSYKYTGLIAAFVASNFFLMSFDFWNKLIAFILLICFIILGMII